jgi:hypothetical protein
MKQEPAEVEMAYMKGKTVFFFYKTLLTVCSRQSKVLL